MKAVYKDLNVDDKFFPIKSAINQMSRWKDQLVSPEQALANPAKDTKGALAARIYAAYEKRLKEAGAFDFDDLIYQTVQLLAEHPDVRDFYQTKYKYLLVDEYQDTSVAQFRLALGFQQPSGFVITQRLDRIAGLLFQRISLGFDTGLQFL